MTEPLRVKNVVAAVVHDSAKRFLVCYNRRWNQYAIPMKGCDPADDRQRLAIQALADHCPLPVPVAVPLQGTAEPLECVGGFGPSWGTGEETYYNYHVYEVHVPGVENWPQGELGSWCGFLAYAQLQASPLVSWSTKQIAQALIEGQEVALPVIWRQSPTGKQFLLVHNAGYHGYFFPAARLRDARDAEGAAREAVCADTGYRGPLESAFSCEADTVHFSPRYGRRRRYRFYVCRITFPGVDLSSPDTPVEQACRENGIQYGWFSEDQLCDPAAHGLSPTVAEVRSHVAQACTG